MATIEWILSGEDRVEKNQVQKNDSLKTGQNMSDVGRCEAGFACSARLQSEHQKATSNQKFWWKTSKGWKRRKKNF